MSEDLPAPSPEGDLIRRAREAYIPRLSLRAAAVKVGISTEYWGHVERGYQPAGRGKPPKPVIPGAQTLAQMAYVVEVTPDELAEAGRPDAESILREIIQRQRARDSARADVREDAEIVRRMAEFFEDPAVSPDEKRILAERFFRILPYYVAGQRPPRDLLGDDDPPANGGSTQSA